MAATPNEPLPRPVERLFPFVRRARLCIRGREAVRRAARQVEFVLITSDLSDNSYREVHKLLDGLPIIQHFHSQDVERLLGLHNTKVVGFRKSDLASAIHRELRETLARAAPDETPATASPVADATESPDGLPLEAAPDDPP